MAAKTILQAQNPLILRCHRLIEAFAKSDDERDFYIDRQEGFIVFVDLDKLGPDLDTLQSELFKNGERYALIPKLTFYETKKIMEGFVNEKVYDIDTKEKMMEIIGSKEAMANFLDFLNDHHSEFEKWQIYYQERSRVRIIEWLRQNHFTFVFEEDLDLPRDLIEKLKKHIFDTRVDKEILAVRKELFNKSKTYYSNEALNPRPKRGRPPKQTTKTEIEPQVTSDMYTTVPTPVLPFLFAPGLGSSPASAFSSRFENLEHAQAGNKTFGTDFNVQTEDLKEKLALLRRLSNRWMESEKQQSSTSPNTSKEQAAWEGEDEENLDEEFDDEDEEADLVTAKRPSRPPPPPPKPSSAKSRLKSQPPKPAPKKAPPPKPKPVSKKPAPPKPAPKKIPPKKPLFKKAPPPPPKRSAPAKKNSPVINKSLPKPFKKNAPPVKKSSKPIAKPKSQQPKKPAPKAKKFVPPPKRKR